MTRVLVVCSGNTCRSPTLQLLLEYRQSQLGIQTISFESAGARVNSDWGEPIGNEGKRALDFAARYLESHGPAPTDVGGATRAEKLRASAEAHRSRSVDGVPHPQTVDRVIYFERKHRRWVTSRWPDLALKQHSVLHFGDWAWLIKSVTFGTCRPVTELAYRIQAHALARRAIDFFKLVTNDVVWRPK